MQDLTMLLSVYVDVPGCVRWILVVAYVALAASVAITLRCGMRLTPTLPCWAPVTVAAETMGAAMAAVVVLLLARAASAALGAEAGWFEAVAAVGASIASIVATATLLRVRPLIARIFGLVES